MIYPDISNFEKMCIRDRGSKEVFLQLKEQHPNVCLVHLYALQGAIDHVDYDKLPDEVKLDLKQFSDRIKEK